MNAAWYIFHGRKFLNMGRQEVMTTRIGEMLDLIACLHIYNGAPPKEEAAAMNFFDLLEVE